MSRPAPQREGKQQLLLLQMLGCSRALLGPSRRPSSPRQWCLSVAVPQPRGVLLLIRGVSLVSLLPTLSCLVSSAPVHNNSCFLIAVKRVGEHHQP